MYTYLSIRPLRNDSFLSKDQLETLLALTPSEMDQIEEQKQDIFKIPGCVRLNRQLPLKTLRSIHHHNLIFISAQPDIPYFHWQTQLYLYQFSQWGIQDRCFAIFGYTGQKASETVRLMGRKFKVMGYPDRRKDKTYIPSVRPHILKQFFAQYPHLGQNVFYHDSDILLPSLPKFELLLPNSLSYLSDTVSYIGYNYVAECSDRYNRMYSKLPHHDLLHKMCNIVGVEPELIKKNQSHAGGAQYLLKVITSQYWENVERHSVEMYKMFLEYEAKYPVDHHIQKWTADMWAVLWNYWKMGLETRTHSELEFSWATDPVTNFSKKHIFHLAGITKADQHHKFYKGAYIRKNPLLEYHRNATQFDYVHSDSATYRYIELLKSYVDCYYDSMWFCPA